MNLNMFLSEPYPEHTIDMFKIAGRKAGINKESLKLSTKHFRNSGIVQLDLFD